MVSLLRYLAMCPRPVWLPTVAFCVALAVSQQDAVGQSGSDLENAVLAIREAFPARRGLLKVVVERETDVEDSSESSNNNSGAGKVLGTVRTSESVVFEGVDKPFCFSRVQAVRTSDSRTAVLVTEQIYNAQGRFHLSSLIIGAGITPEGNLDQVGQRYLDTHELPAILWHRNMSIEEGLSPLFSGSAAVFLGVFSSGGKRLDVSDDSIVAELESTSAADGQEVRHASSGLTFKIANGVVTRWESHTVAERKENRLVYVPLEFGQKGEIVAYSFGLASSKVRNVVRLRDSRELDVNADFQRLGVRSDHRVTDNENRNLRLAWNNGLVATVIDPEAEERIYGRDADDSGNLNAKVSSGRGPVLRQAFLGESASSKQCGVYSFAYAASKLGVVVPLVDVVSEKYLTSKYGSSAQDLVNAASDFGLWAQPVSNASLSLLRLHGNPALLHFRDLAGAGGHWVVFEGFDESGAMLICDLPDETAALPAADVMTYWDGNVVLLSKEKGRGQILYFSRVYQALPLILVVVIFYVLGWTTSWETIRYRKVRGASLFVVALIAGLVWAAFSNLGYLRNRDAVSLTMGNDAFGKEGDIAVAHSIPRGARLIDARLSSDFQRGHIEGSINVPVNSRLMQFRRLVTSIDRGDTLVVYCNNSKCAWADKVAKRLVSVGYSNVSIYRPGYQGYLSEYGEQ